MNEETVQVGPGTATVDVSDDGTVFTFHLMENIPWVHYNADTDAVEEVMDDSGNVRYADGSGLCDRRSFAPSTPQTAGPYQYVLTPWIMGGDAFGSSDAAR